MISCDYCTETSLECRRAGTAKGWVLFRFDDNVRFYERSGCPEHSDQAREDMLAVMTRKLQNKPERSGSYGKEK